MDNFPFKNKSHHINVSWCPSYQLTQQPHIDPLKIPHQGDNLHFWNPPCVTPYICLAGFILESLDFFVSQILLSAEPFISLS